MTDFIAVPNVSEGRDEAKIARFVAALERHALHVADVHADPVHNRCVLTAAGDGRALVAAMAELALECAELDLTRHRGVHPRLGVLDVCPIVPHDGTLADAIRIAHRTGEAIATRAGLPVYFYGDAALRPATRELPDLRRGGLERLTERATNDLPPDVGPARIDPRRGVVCVGARHVLIAFNVWLECDEATAKQIAGRVRSESGVPVEVRALGLRMNEEVSQVSMNLIAPEKTGIDDAFAAVAASAEERGITVRATEIVGLVPERFLPSPDARAARLLLKPGRSLESALER